MTPAYGTAPVSPAPRALVVDDESAIRSVLQRYLQRRGWHVDLAQDGEEALGFLGASQRPRDLFYDLIIVDMRMQRMGGAELHRWVAEHRPEALDRFVMATGDACEHETALFLEQSGCRVLEKPFELPTLEEILSALRVEERPVEGRVKSA